MSNASSKSLPDSNETNEQMLNDIQTLQKMEQELFNSLENNPTLKPDQQKKIIEKMNQLSNMRINLYQTLSGLNNYYKNALQSSQGTLQEQTTAIYIVENELNKSKRRLEMLNTEKNNKIRLVEINNYYGDKYAEHGDLMKIIIFTLVPVIILAIINSKGLLPSAIYYVLIAIIAAIGGYFFWTRFTSIVTRDNMNYQTYDWYFDASQAPGPPTDADSTDPWASTSGGMCIDSACCSTGQKFDSTINKCVINTSASTTATSTTATSTNTTENFTPEMIQSVLTRGANKLKGDVSLSDIMPHEGISFINQ